MKKSTKIVLFVVLAGLLLCGLLLVVFLGALLGGGGAASVPRQAYLELEIGAAPPEITPEDPLSSLLSSPRLRMRDWVEALDAASRDARIRGLVVKVAPSGMGFGQIQELRDALVAFRKAGKPTIAWADTFGEFGPGDGAYYLATACDEIYLQPSGDIGLAGLMAESPFLRGAFDKAGIVPRMDHRHEFKNAMNMYTEKAFTEAHRRATQELLDSLWSQMLTGIAEARKMPPEQLRALVGRGPFLGQEAKDAQLVDALAYRDEVFAKAAERFGTDEAVTLGNYWAAADKPNRKGTPIALIYGVGAVQRGEGGHDPLTGSFVLGGDSVAEAFRDAIEDEDIQAIVFRVDSPGGSYVASDTVWRETVRAKQAGKPVIVSMVDVAGSGGYFVAMEADKIVAQPSTITGSIGVLGGKLLTNGLWDKIGISFDSVQTGGMADMWSSSHDYGEAEWSRFQAWLDRVYEDFTSKVAAGRKLPKDKVLEIAKGRIWTGETAKTIGLVDELGGFPTAFRLAREAAGLEPQAAIEIREFPRPRTTWEILTDKSQATGTDAVFLRMVETLRPLAQVAQRTGLLGPKPGVLSMEEMVVTGE
jgi:protease IV